MPVIRWGMVLISIVLRSHYATVDDLPRDWQCITWVETRGENIESAAGQMGWFQFTERSWLATGEKETPLQATLGEQFTAARRLLGKQGSKAWPEDTCGLDSVW